jgi:antirestriction protein ArdC
MNTTTTKKSRDVYQAITDAIVTSVEAGTVPWRQPWRAEVGAARNAFTDRGYSGINTLLLGLAPYDDPRWATYRQIGEHGGQVRKGERGQLVCFFKHVEAAKRNTESENEGGEDGRRGRYALLRSYIVFNVTQADALDLPPLPSQLERQIEPLAAAEGVLANYPPDPPRVVGGASAATYNPRHDVIRIPAVGAFESVEAYYLTLWHELTHSTGHPSRLDRGDLIGSRFGDAKYAREELTAEIGSAMIAARTAIVPPNIEQSASYIASWLNALRNDKKLIVIAAGRAQKAADWILETPSHDEPQSGSAKQLHTAASRKD